MTVVFEAGIPDTSRSLLPSLTRPAAAIGGASKATEACTDGDLQHLVSVACLLEVCVTILTWLRHACSTGADIPRNSVQDKFIKLARLRNCISGVMQCLPQRYTVSCGSG